jgi:hypothetical protein
MELFSGALVTMTGEDILNWLLAVSSGQKDWYTLLPLCLPHPLSTNESSLTSPVNTWAEFTCGWVHAATGIFICNSDRISLLHTAVIFDTEFHS